MRSRAPLALLTAVQLIACGPAPEPASPSQTSAVMEIPPPSALAPPVEEPLPVATAVPTAAPPPRPAPPPVAAYDPAAEPMRDITDAPELARAVSMLQKSQPGAARKELEAALAALGPDGAPDVILAARTLIARVCVRLKDDACVSREIAAAIALWSRHDTWSRIAALGADDQAKRQRLGRALSAAGEAYFLAAEQKRAVADRIALPAYRGSGEQKDVMAFLNKHVAEWIRAKRPAIEEADRAYVRIVEMQPVAPPRWVVAAGARVGAMWAAFADDFRNRTPVPAAWKGEGEVKGASGLTYAELRREYFAKLDEAAEPQRERARAAFQKCSEWARRYRVTGDDAKACDAWLSAHPSKP